MRQFTHQNLVQEVISHIDSIQDAMTGHDALSFSHVLRRLVSLSKNATAVVTPSVIAEELSQSVLPTYLVSYKIKNSKNNNWSVWHPFHTSGLSSGCSFKQVKSESVFDVSRIHKATAIEDRRAVIKESCIAWCRLRIFTLAKTA